MRSELVETSVAELLAQPLRNGLTRPKRVRGSGVPMVNMGELFAHRRIGDVEMERVPLHDRHPERDLLEPRDLLFARQSIVAEGAGKVSLFLGAGEPATFESHLIRARIDRTRANPDWLFYFFESPQGRARVRSIVTQVAAAGIRGSDLAGLLVPCPDLHQQREVAAVLSALDDKIDSNRRVAGLLEGIASAEFDARFRDFAGDNWRTGTLGEIATVHRAFVKGEDTAPYIGLDLMPRASTVLTEWLIEDAPSGQAATFERGDLLFGKLRPYFRKAGVAPIDGRCSTEILVLRPSRPEYYGILLGHVTSDRFFERCEAISRGTRMPRAEWKDASSLEIAVPPIEAAAEFTGLVKTLYKQIVALTHESRTLAAVRDALLPKLVSGDIRVPDTPDPEEVIGLAPERTLA